ncbi:hypothetical protein R5R35_014010 [Gryllus longicercus]|uniref:TNase-like domain-containing protein n=1 Tax=Gryllus longicercus TaxID=2509291 RepID=A0AAN9WJ18_9ORTH
MSKEPNLFEKFTVLMDQNIRGVQYGVYSVAVVGLAIALRSVRPFKKFYRPQDFPTSFIEKHIKLHGKAVGVIPPFGSSPPLLLIDHTPILSLQWIRPQTPDLPVEISSINLTPNGLSWLQHVVVGTCVEFSILKVNPTSVSCIVTKQKKNVGLDLVSLGFASVSPLDFHLEKDSLYLKYYQQLLHAENRAEKKGNGIWAKENVGSIPRLLQKVPNKMNHLTLNALNALKNGILKKKTKLQAVAAGNA